MTNLETLLADLVSGDDARAERSIPAILEWGEAAIPPLLKLTVAESVDSRWWAVRALAASPHAPTVDLLRLLKDSSSEVRAAAALALCNHPHELAISKLIDSLSDEDSLVAGLAGNALVHIGIPAVPSLLEVMHESPAIVRILALRALAEIKDQRAIPTLMRCLDEDSAILQYWAREGLNRLGLDMVYIRPRG